MFRELEITVKYFLAPSFSLFLDPLSHYAIFTLFFIVLIVFLNSDFREFTLY